MQHDRDDIAQLNLSDIKLQLLCSWVHVALVRSFWLMLLLWPLAVGYCDLADVFVL